MKTTSHILIYETVLPNRPLEDLELGFLSHSNLSIDKQEREVQAYASLEWSIPSIIFALITTPYFQSFLTELGSDHYSILKAWVISMHKKFRNVKTITLTSSGPKRDNEAPNNFFTIYYTIPNGNLIKVYMPQCETVEKEEQALSFIFDDLIKLYKKPNGKFSKKINGLVNNNFDDIYAIYNSRLEKWEYYSLMMLIKKRTKK